MSKAVKSVTRAAKKITKSTLGVATGGLSEIFGAGGLKTPTDNAAKQMAEQARANAMTQQAQAAEQARASAMQMRTDADRQRILAEQAQQNPVDTDSPEIVGSETESAAERRRKFREPQVGGTGGGGPSIRL